MEFIAEVKRTSQRKSASLDNVFQVVLETNDSNAIELAKLPADVTVRVIIEVNK